MKKNIFLFIFLCLGMAHAVPLTDITKKGFKCENQTLLYPQFSWWHFLNQSHPYFYSISQGEKTGWAQEIGTYTVQKKRKYRVFSISIQNKNYIFYGAFEGHTMWITTEEALLASLPKVKKTAGQSLKNVLKDKKNRLEGFESHFSFITVERKDQGKWVFMRRVLLEEMGSFNYAHFELYSEDQSLIADELFMIVAAIIKRYDPYNLFYGKKHPFFMDTFYENLL